MTDDETEPQERFERKLTGWDAVDRAQYWLQQAADIDSGESSLPAEIIEIYLREEIGFYTPNIVVEGLLGAGAEQFREFFRQHTNGALAGAFRYLRDHYALDKGGEGDYTVESFNQWTGLTK